MGDLIIIVLVGLPFLVEDLGGGVSCILDIISSPDDDEAGDAVSTAFFFVGVVADIDITSLVSLLDTTGFFVVK